MSPGGMHLYNSLTVCVCVCVCVRVQVSSVQVVRAYIDRIQEVNPFLNAVIKDRQETILPLSSDIVLCFL